METIEKVVEEGSELNRELGIRYIAARIAGYGIDELYGLVTDSIAVVCNEGTLREMIDSAPLEFREELDRFLVMPSKAGMMRMFRYNREGLKMGWVNPPAGMEELIAEKRAELGGVPIGKIVGRC